MEKKQTVVKWFKQQLDNLDIEIPQSIFEQALEMENKINQEYYNEGAQDCKNVFEKIISDVTGNINNI
jgi:uncharacterized protein (DUF2164 family)